MAVLDVAQATVKDQLTLSVGGVNDIVISAVLRKLAQHSPFMEYSLGVVVNAVLLQLQHQTHVLGVRDGQLVAYAGWIRVDKTDAEQWRAGLRDIPEPNWNEGDAAISTIIIADDPSDLIALVRAVSDACAGVPVYRARIFPDARAEQRRPPITGRTRRASHA